MKQDENIESIVKIITEKHRKGVEVSQKNGFKTNQCKTKTKKITLICNQIWSTAA